MLRRLLFCMILAAIIQYIIRMTAVTIFERRFLKDADSINVLYQAVYPVLRYGFSEENSLIVGAKFEYGGWKIEFENPLEGSILFENVVQKALKNYYRVLDLVYLNDEQIANLQIDICKRELEDMCHKIKMLRDCAEKS